MSHKVGAYPVAAAVADPGFTVNDDTLLVAEEFRLVTGSG